MPRLRDLTAKELFGLYAPFGGALLFGLTLRYAYPQQWWLSEIIRLAGDAFSVAGILGFVVELFVTGRLIEHTAKSLSHRLVGYGLPSELQGEIRKIVETRLVRYNTTKRYRILRPRDGKVEVHITYSFEVRNHGDILETYAPWIAEEDVYEPRFDYLEYGIVGEVGHSFSDTALRDFLTAREPDRGHEINAKDGLKLLPNVKLESYRTHPSSVCRVEWRYRLTMQQNDSDITSFAGATIGAQVHIDELPTGFRFVGETADSTKSGELSWTYTRPFLPNQHIRVRWFPA